MDGRSLLHESQGYNLSSRTTRSHGSTAWRQPFLQAGSQRGDVHKLLNLQLAKLISHYRDRPVIDKTLGQSAVNITVLHKLQILY